MASPFAIAFENELLKLAVKYPDPDAPPMRPLTVREFKMLQEPYRKPRAKGIPASEQKKRWPKPPGMMATGKPIPIAISKKDEKKGGGKFRWKGKPTTGGRWNIRNPRREIVTHVKAEQARRRSLPGGDLEEATTLAED